MRLNDNATILTKHTYLVVDGSTINSYNDSGTVYINTGLKIPTTNSYITKIQGSTHCMTVLMSGTSGSDTLYV